MHGGGKYDTYYAKYDGSDDVLRYYKTMSLSSRIYKQLIYIGNGHSDDKFDVDILLMQSGYETTDGKQQQIESIINKYVNENKNGIINNTYINTLRQYPDNRNISFICAKKYCNILLMGIPIEVIDDAHVFFIGLPLMTVEYILNTRTGDMSIYTDLEVRLVAHACMVMQDTFPNIPGFCFTTCTSKISYHEKIINVFNCTKVESIADEYKIHTPMHTHDTGRNFTADIPTNEELIEILKYGYIRNTDFNIRKHFYEHHYEEDDTFSKLIQSNMDIVYGLKYIYDNTWGDLKAHFDNYPQQLKDDANQYMSDFKTQKFSYFNVVYAWKIVNKTQRHHKHIVTYRDTMNELIALLTIFTTDEDNTGMYITLPCISPQYAILATTSKYTNHRNIYIEIINDGFKYMRKQYGNITKCILIRPEVYTEGHPSVSIPAEITQHGTPSFVATDAGPYMSHHDRNNYIIPYRGDFGTHNHGTLYRLFEQPDHTMINDYKIIQLNTSEYTDIILVMENIYITIYNVTNYDLRINKFTTEYKLPFIDGISYNDLLAYMQSQLYHRYVRINLDLCVHNKLDEPPYPNNKYVIIRNDTSGEIITAIAYAQHGDAIVYKLCAIHPVYMIKQIIQGNTIGSIYTVINNIFKKLCHVLYIFVTSQIIHTYNGTISDDINKFLAANYERIGEGDHSLLTTDFNIDKPDLRYIRKAKLSV